MGYMSAFIDQEKDRTWTVVYRGYTRADGLQTLEEARKILWDLAANLPIQYSYRALDFPTREWETRHIAADAFGVRAD